MKSLIVFVVCTLIVTLSAFSQTEVWRVYGKYSQLQEDGKGNTYIANGTHNDSNIPDTLKKVGPAGDILWSVPLGINQCCALCYSGSGIYVMTRLEWWNIPPAPDTISYYDTLGVKQWSYVLPAGCYNNLPGSQQDAYVRDGEGNLILRYDSLSQVRFGSHSGIRKLLKLDKAGKVVFNVLLPDYSAKKMHITIYYGPVADASGNIWMTAEAETTAINKHSPNLDEFFSIEAMVFNKVNGSLMKRVKLFEDLRNHDKWDKQGNPIASYSNGGDVGTHLTTYKDNLVAYGTNYVIKQTWSKSMTTEDTRSEWRWAVVNQQGKAKFFSYKGKGVYVDRQKNYKMISADGNQLTGIAVADNGAFLFDGTLQLTPNGGEPVIARFDPFSKKPQWTIYQVPGSMFFYHAGQKIFAAEGPHAIKVYHLNGTPSLTQLTFTDQVTLGSTLSPPHRHDLQGPNYEQGYFYATGNGLAPDRYLAKYSITGLVPAPQQNTGRVDGLTPSEFSLEQNYPNPFNPATLIQYSLPKDSYVKLSVYNILGQHIADLIDGFQQAGSKSVEFKASNLSSGVYIYTLKADGFSSTKKMILTK